MGLAWQTLDLINKNFQLRTCTMEIDGKADRPCLEYHIKRCLGPCVESLCSLNQYNEAVGDVELLLQGRTSVLEGELKTRMLEASDELRFEAAARYRDQLRTIKKLGEQQKMMTITGDDVDIFGYYREGNQLALSLFTMREGKVAGKARLLLGRHHRAFRSFKFYWASALKQYYLSGDYAPGEIYLSRSILKIVLFSRNS